MTDAYDATTREHRMAELGAAMGETLTCDHLTGRFRIFQRRRGHRHSTDDLLTAVYALTHGPERRPATLLDLGTGIGSVGLAVLDAHPHATLVAIEAQDVSFRLFQENVAMNGVTAKVTAIHGDLREVALHRTFDLVTGSPPYFDPKDGIVSADSQRAHARFELRGDVNDYCRAAVRTIAEGGRFVFCFPTAQRARALRACADAALPVVSHVDVVPRATLPALFTLFSCARPGEHDAPPIVETPFVVRDESGRHTPEMDAARRLLGFDVPAGDTT
ncbi:MAG: methyltransferase [Polyangiaceae bacterium]